MISIKAYKYRIYSNKKQAEKLQWTLDRVRELYNAALQERRDAYEIMVRRHPNFYDEDTRQQLARAHASSFEQQSGQLPEIKEVREEYQEIYSQVLQDMLHRVKKAFDDFFERVRAGKTPGYPRFKGKDHFDSFCYPQSGFSLTEDNRICLSKIGTIKVKIPKGKKARPMLGKKKTCTIKREGEHWYIIIVCEETQDVVYHPSEKAVGIDLGLLHFATLSDGSRIDNPRYLRAAQAKLARSQQAIAKKKRDRKSTRLNSSHT